MLYSFNFDALYSYISKDRVALCCVVTCKIQLEWLWAFASCLSSHVYGRKIWLTFPINTRRKMQRLLKLISQLLYGSFLYAWIHKSFGNFLRNCRWHNMLQTVAMGKLPLPVSINVSGTITLLNIVGFQRRVFLLFSDEYNDGLWEHFELLKGSSILKCDHKNSNKFMVDFHSLLIPVKFHFEGPWRN